MSARARTQRLRARLEKARQAAEQAKLELEQAEKEANNDDNDDNDNNDDDDNDRVASGIGTNSEKQNETASLVEDQTPEFVQSLLQSIAVVPPLVETALGKECSQRVVAPLLVTTLDQAKEGALAVPLGLASAADSDGGVSAVGRAVNVILLDVSGSQQASEKLLHEMLLRLNHIDSNNTTVVVCFGEKKDALFYTANRETRALKNQVVRLSRRAPMSLHDFLKQYAEDTAKVQTLQAQANRLQYEPRPNVAAIQQKIAQIQALCPFYCATYTDALGVALRLLHSRGTFDNANCSLLFVGDGAFSGANGMTTFQTLLGQLANEGIFDNFCRFVLAPSPHTDDQIFRTLRDYCLQFCQRCEGIMPYVVGANGFKKAGGQIETALWTSAIVEALGLLSPNANVGAGTPYRVANNLVYHAGVVELPRQTLASVLGFNLVAACAVVDALRQVIADPLQIGRFQSDRVFAALYAACVSLYRMTEEDNEFTNAFKTLTDLVSTLRTNKDLTDEHQRVIIELLAESKRDPVVFKWLSKNRKVVEERGAAFYITCARDLPEDVVTDMANGVPKRENQIALLQWLCSLEVETEIEEEQLQTVRYIAVPKTTEESCEDASLLFRIVQCLPTLRAKNACNSWNARISLTVLMLAVTELRARTLENKNGLEVPIAGLFRRVLVQRCWEKQLEFSSVRMPENFSFYFVSLVTHCFAQLDAHFCSADTAHLYEQLNRCQRLRHAVSSVTDVVVEQEYERAAEGSIERVRHDQWKIPKDARILRWLHDFYSQPLDEPLKFSQIEPFLYGVPEPLDDEWLLALGIYNDVREHIGRDHTDRALGLVLDLQCRHLLQRGNRLQQRQRTSPYYRHIESAIRSVGGRENIPRFGRDDPKAAVRDFFVLAGQTKLVREVAQVNFPVRQLLEQRSIALALGIHPDLAAIACGQGRVKEPDARVSLTIPRIAPVDVAMLEPVKLRCRTHEYVTTITLSDERLAAVVDRINALIARQLRPNRIVGEQTFQVQYESCCGCFMDLPVTASRMVSIEPCGHTMCRRCLEQWTRLVPGKQLVEASQQCPMCRSPIAPPTLALFDAQDSPPTKSANADDREAEQRLTRAEYNADVMDKAREMLEQNYVMLCEECHEPFSAAERACQVRIEALSTLCEKCRVPEGSKLCPGCGVSTELTSGCFHITCPTEQCRRNDVHWCWHCGKHEDNNGRKFTHRSIYQHACFNQPDAYNVARP